MGKHIKKGSILIFSIIAIFILVVSCSSTVREGLSNITSYSTPNTQTEEMPDLFKGVQFRPDCCPSAYSTSTGCPCVEAKQKQEFSSRGGNV